MNASKINFKLNGESISVDAEAGTRFSRVLREELGLTGTKVGCNAGDCGACTILVDNKPICACMMALQQANGCNIETVEGLQNGCSVAKGNLQKSFLRYGAAQCGICTPGMIVAAEALLRRIPHPSEQQAENAIGGVLCRCTGYRNIIHAIVNANVPENHSAPHSTENKSSVGEPIIRLDGAPKVAGSDLFAADDWPDDALYAIAIRSPYPHAAFSFGNLDAYVNKTDEVVAVYTAKDVLGRNCFGVIPEFVDQPVLAESETRFEGEAVALVVGTTDDIVTLNISKLPITWQKLADVTTANEATDEGAPQLHEGRANNRLTGGYVESGDVQSGFEAADVVVEGAFTTEFIEHAYIEPEAAFAQRIGDRIEVWSCTQAPYMDRSSLAEIMNISEDQVRIIPSSVGGGFGSKLDLSLQPFVAIAAWHLKQPVKMVYSRTESMLSTTKRHPSSIQSRIGASKDGKIVAMTFDGIFNTGAYASWGPTVANRVPIHACGPYRIENYRAESAAIHTHCPPSGAFRGFGVPQSAVAQETLFDLLAEKLKIDPLEFRVRNALVNGLPTATGQRFDSGVGIVACLEALRPQWQQAIRNAEMRNESAQNTPMRFGVGIAGLWYGCGNTSLPNPSTIRVALRNDGRVILFQGAIDIGQGSNTVISQICADAIGISIDCFDLVYGDTDLTADAGKTSASRQTFISGKAAFLAGNVLRNKLLKICNAPISARLQLNGNTLLASAENSTYKLQLDSLPADQNGFIATAEETYDPPTQPLDKDGQGEPYASFGYGAQMVELSVDTALGTTKLIKVTAAHDVGKVINPVLAEGQVHGGVAQGIGMALMEKFVPGKTNNLHDYLIPTAGDVPEIETLFIEETDPHGPYGAKGLGEHVLVGTAPAILNAIRRATGAVIRDLPASPDRVLAAIKSKQSGY
ncbi:MAG: molybdopterin-dependent oxidoreductase [Woeseiaceae bacterium]|nr:molybdopterin-dependent oxidoreductase [Woeseiaceae bacterium]